MRQHDDEYFGGMPDECVRWERQAQMLVLSAIERLKNGDDWRLGAILELGKALNLTDLRRDAVKGFMVALCDYECEIPSIIHDEAPNMEQWDEAIAAARMERA